MSLLADCRDALLLCAKHGVNAITTCEEAFYPINSNPTLTLEIDKLAKEIAKMVSVDRCSLLTYIKWTFRYMDLFYLIYITKKHLNEINVPTLVVQSQNDELVSYKSLKVFENKLKNKYNRHGDQQATGTDRAVVQSGTRKRPGRRRENP